MQRIEHVAVGLQQHAFGDFQFEARCRKAGLPEGGNDRQSQHWIAELHWREVHGDGGFDGPTGGIAACLFEHPIAERHDQADFLGHRNKLFGRNQAALRMLPAQQCLKSADVAAGQIDEWLIVEFEFVALERLAQVELELAPILHLRIHLRLEEMVGTASIGLRAVQRHIGVAQELIGFVAVAGAMAMPILVPTISWCPCTSKGSASSAMILPASSLAPAGLACRWTIANSSPPRRATVSLRATTRCSRSVTAHKSASPTECPRESLTLLKRSRSRNITAMRSPRPSAFSILSWNRTRLGKLVSASCRAIWMI